MDTMPNADPLGGDTPYEVLGVTETDTLDTIEAEKDRVFTEYREQKRQARQRQDNDAFQEADEAMQAIVEAWQWMEQNHDPPAADQPVSIDLRTDDPRVGAPIALRVTGADGPVETIVEARRDGATLSAEETGADGTVEFTVGSYGPVEFTALTSPDYDDATVVATVDRKEVALSFDGVPTTAEVDESVPFTVVAEGSPEANVDVSTSSSTLGTTGSNGTVTHAFGSVGTRTVTATKPDDDQATYADCTTQVDVTPETVDLDVVVDGSDHELGETVTVHVTESESGRPVENATVTAGGESATTGATGEATLTLAETGSVRVEATKDADGDKRYGTARTTVTVSKRERSLSIDDVEGERMENSTLTVSVIDGDRNPLSGASVTTDWGHDETTDGDGEATLQLDDDGSLRIEASKETDEESFGTDVRVEQIDEFTRTLAVDCEPSPASPGDSVTVRVRDNTGTAVSGAEVTCDDRIGETWTTGPGGEATVPLKNEVGIRRITVRDDDAEEQTTLRVL
jgi:hypothetical protein